MDLKKLTDEEILKLEFIHDNPDDTELILQSPHCLDMIGRKIIKINEENIDKDSLKNPEKTMKKYIFENIEYNEIKILNGINVNKITEQDKLKFKDTIVLVFDNLQLKTQNIELLKYIFSRTINNK
jgi:hypothetical protein